jgi:hypothetical protein
MVELAGMIPRPFGYSLAVYKLSLFEVVSLENNNKNKQKHYSLQF